ncbi:MAG: hypothetical protein ACFCUQ_01855 [Kiloniellales bacterium]
MQLEVECYAGHRGEETPRSLSIDGKRIEVTEVLDRWLAPDHRYFKLLCAGGATYILRHDPAAARWDLVMYERAPRARGHTPIGR